MRPIFNPTASDIPTFIAESLKKFSHSFQTCIPAIVSKVETDGKVTVSPAVQQTNSDWQPVAWADITVPVLTPYGNQIVISFPCSAGDTGWLVGSDLDTSLWLKNSTRPAKQNTLLRHRYQFGFFVPSKITGYTRETTDDGAVVLSSLDGKTKISIKPDAIDITSNDTLKINAKSITITSKGNNVVIDGVNFKNHTHDTTAAVGQVVVDPTKGTNTTPLTWTSKGVN